MTKPFLYLLILITFFSCKKKENENEISPEPTANSAIYETNLNTILTYDVQNGVVIDTVLSFNGDLLKKLNGQYNFENFTSLSYNSSTTPFGILNNYLNSATISNWGVTSNLIGNFNYTDSTAIPNCLSCGTMSPTVGRFTGLNLTLTGITNATHVYVEVQDLTFINPNTNTIDSYTIAPGTTTLTTNPYSSYYSNFVSTGNINDNVLLTITFVSYKTKIINGHSVYFNKKSTYSYQTKIVN